MKKSFYLINNIFIFICIFSSCQNDTNYTFYYPNSLTLNNGGNVLLANDGIHFFDSSFTIEDSDKKYIFSNDSHKISSKEDYSKSEMVQFSEEDGEYIMILAMNIIYFFEQNGNLLDKADLSEYINADYYSLVPFKRDDNYLHYIISQKNSEHNFTINHFRFQYNSPFSNELFFSKKVNVSIQLFQYPNLENFHGPSCLFLNYKFACFYSIYQPGEMHSRVFDPDNNFEEIPGYFQYFADNIDFVVALTNNEKEKAFILVMKGDCPYSLTFDYHNFFSTIKEEKLGNECGIEVKKYNINFKYFRQAREFILVPIKYGSNPPLTIMYFNNDYSSKERGKLKLREGVYSINTCSPYLYNGEFYLIYDHPQFPDTITYIIKIENLEEKETGTSIETTTIPTIPATSIETTTIPTIPATEPSFTKNIKCKTATYESSNYDLCTECDNDNGYFSVDLDDSYLHGFVECYKSETKPSNFYFDRLVSKFKLCYQTCKKCNNGGDVNTQNCLECDDNYIKEPDKDSTNCVVACNYMYYYNNYGQYKCTVENKCPDEYKLYIEELKKCTNDCSKEEIYKYKYGGKCLKNCPENTSKNEEDKTCLDIDLDSCSKTENEFLLKQELDLDEIDLNAKNYAEEFSYTDKHVSYYYNDLYSILFYKDSSCVEELSLKMPKVDFGNCYSKILDNLNPPTTDKIIIVLIEKINKQKKSSTTYLFYHPNTGQKIDAATICKGEEIIIKQSVLSQLNNSNVNIEDVLFLAKQNIDVFNISDQFYTDLCFHFDSPNGKDIPLKDRMLTYYPNVTLCDEGCETKGVNLTAMESMCECKFNDIMNLGDNVLLKNTLGGITDLLSSSNIFVLKCYKDVFEQKYFIKNTGGFIIIALTGLEVILSILFFAIDITKIFSYLYSLTEAFISSMKSKKRYKNANDNFLTIPSTENAPPHKKESKKDIKRSKAVKK